MNVDPAAIAPRRARAAGKSCRSAYGGSRAAAVAALQAGHRSAQAEADRLKDEFVSTEHLLHRASPTKAAARPSAQLLKQQRRHARRDSPGADERPRLAARHQREPRRHLPGAREVRPRPHRAGAQGQARSGDRPRRGDPPRHPGAVAPHQEQPGADRRARRRQDRDRRRAGQPHRPRRRARRAQEQAHRRARHGRAHRRREIPRRVRGAAEGGAEGNHRRRRARSSCSSTSCTPWSAPARPKGRWTRPTC